MPTQRYQDKEKVEGLFKQKQLAWRVLMDICVLHPQHRNAAASK